MNSSYTLGGYRIPFYLSGFVLCLPNLANVFLASMASPIFFGLLMHGQDIMLMLGRNGRVDLLENK